MRATTKSPHPTSAVTPFIKEKGNYHNPRDSFQIQNTLNVLIGPTW